MLDQHSEQSYQTIVNRLRALGVQWRLLLIFQCLLHCLAVIALALSVALVIDQLLPIPRLIRMGLVLLVLGVGVYAVIFNFHSSRVWKTYNSARGSVR